MLARYNETYAYYSTPSRNTQVLLYRRKATEEQKVKRKQKMLGFVAVGISVLELLAGYMGMIDECGVFIFLLPIGLYALFTKEKMI